MIRRFLLLLPGIALAACSHAITDSHLSLDGLPAGLEVRFTVTPDEVSQHGPFAVQLDVTNTTKETVWVITAHSCLALPHVFRDGRRIPFEGSAWGCYAAITTHTFLPGQVWTMTWNMRASLYGEHPGDVEGAPAPKGTYRVRAEFDTFSEAGPAPKPAVERMLQVR
jgi:hypothetical protein